MSVASLLTSLADAVRGKTGDTDKLGTELLVSEAIRLIQAGGGGSGNGAQVLVEEVVTLSSTVSSTYRTIYTNKELAGVQKYTALFLPAGASGNANVLAIVASHLLPYSLVYYKTTSTNNQAACSSTTADMLTIVDGTVRVCSKLTNYPIAKGEYLLMVIA